MTKDLEYAISEGLIALLNIHLSAQLNAYPDNKEMRDARDKYIASTIRLLEQATADHRGYIGVKKSK